MALLRNGGEYTVRIGVLGYEMHPGTHFSSNDFITGPTGAVAKASDDIGSGLEKVPPGDCRYIQAERVGDGAYAVAVRHDGAVITSVKIGPHEFWEFNGENFNPGGSGDCKNNHGW